MMVVVMVMMVVMIVTAIDIRPRHHTEITVMMMVMMMVVVMIKELGQLHRLLLGCFRGKPRVVSLQSLHRIRNWLQQIPIAGGLAGTWRRRGLGSVHRAERCRGAEKTGNFLVHSVFPYLECPVTPTEAAATFN